MVPASEHQAMAVSEALMGTTSNRPLHVRFATSTQTTTTTEVAAPTTTSTPMSISTATTNTTRRILRTSEARGPTQYQSQVKMALHHQLLTAGERRRVYNMKHEFHDVAHQENGAPKSMKVFKGEAKDILHGIFLVLLLRFLLVLAVALGVIGGVGVLILLLKHPNARLASSLGYFY